MNQPRLVDVPAEPKLTERQALAWACIRCIAGITAEELGAILHANKTPAAHDVDSRCRFCKDEGLSILRSVALKPLVIRRRATGLWEPRNPADRVRGPSAQETGELPDDLFGGA
jgi:hypothetical protein